MNPPSPWRQALRPSSFRGVPFETRSRSLKGGRRLAEHVYPERDDSYPEDLGDKTGRWSVEAFIVGPDYMPARDRLIAALRQKGPGDYIDLWGRSHQVVVESWTLAETITQGGYCTIAIEMIAWAGQSLHLVGADTGHAVRLAAATAETAVISDFAGRLDIRGPGLLLDDLTLMVDGLVQDVSRAAASPFAALDAARGAAAPVLNLAAQLRSDLPRLAGLPASLGGGIAQVLTGTLSLYNPGLARYRAARRLIGLVDADWSGTAIIPTTPTRRRMADNRTATLDLVRLLSGIAAARETSSIAYDVYDDAVAIRDETALDLDQRMMSAGDPLYDSLSHLRSAVVRDITVRGADLARLTDITADASLPALVLAHRIYGDATREDDVLTRNRHIRHPGFVRGGVRIRVPVDG